MILDNAISDFEKMMKHQEDTAAYNIRHGGTEYAKMAKANKKKAFEYRQLAEWLKELKHLRNLVNYSRDFHCTIEKAEKELRIAEEHFNYIESLNEEVKE